MSIMIIGAMVFLVSVLYLKAAQDISKNKFWDATANTIMAAVFLTAVIYGVSQ